MCTLWSSHFPAKPPDDVEKRRAYLHSPPLDELGQPENSFDLSICSSTLICSFPNAQMTQMNRSDFSIDYLPTTEWIIECDWDSLHPILSMHIKAPFTLERCLSRSLNTGSSDTVLMPKLQATYLHACWTRAIFSFSPMGRFIHWFLFHYLKWNACIFWAK